MTPFKRMAFEDMRFSEEFRDMVSEFDLVFQKDKNDFEVYDNDEYRVWVQRNAVIVKGTPIHQMSIQRRCDKLLVSWAHKYQIKNEIFGSEYDAVERFPPKSELIDEADMYHLFVISSPKIRYPYDLKFQGFVKEY